MARLNEMNECFNETISIKLACITCYTEQSAINKSRQKANKHTFN